MTTLEDIRSLLEQGGGIAVVTAGELRQLRGAQRLGRHVRESIIRQLDAEGISILSRKLPNDQRQQVTLYDRGSFAGRLVALALEAARRA